MPTTRRSSSTSHRGPRYSLPATFDSSTKVTEEKIMARRKARSSAKASATASATTTATQTTTTTTAEAEKENDLPTIQSPTPYWKVARERGMSPTETRSAKKKKGKKRELDPDEDHERDIDRDGSGKVLSFSPSEKNDAEQPSKTQGYVSSRYKSPAATGDIVLFSNFTLFPLLFF